MLTKKQVGKSIQDVTSNSLRNPHTDPFEASSTDVYVPMRLVWCLSHQLGSGECNTLCVVARTGSDHPLCKYILRKLGHLVVGTTQLEAEHRLQVLSLEKQRVVATHGITQFAGNLKRGLNLWCGDFSKEEAGMGREVRYATNPEGAVMQAHPALGESSRMDMCFWTKPQAGLRHSARLGVEGEEEGWIK